MGQCENITSCTGWPVLHAKATASAFIQTLSPGKNMTHAMDQIVLLSLPDCFVLSNPFLWMLPDLAFFLPLQVLFWVLLCVGVSPPCNEGHQPPLLFIPTVTVHPSDEDTMFNNGCPLGTNWKWICTDINTLFTTIIKPECTQGRLNHFMLRCVMFNGRCIWIVYLLFIPQIKAMPHFLGNWMIKRFLLIITTYQTIAEFDFI